MSQIPQSYTRAGPLIPRGDRLQEPIDAIREIWAYLASLDGREAFYPQERFQATIISGFPVAQTNSLGSGVPMSGNSPDYTDARYCVVRVLTYQSNVNDLPPLGVDQDSTNSGIADATYVTATNLAEILGGNGHILPTNGSLTVEVFGVWDVGNPQQKHYYFCTMPAVAWLCPTSPIPSASLGSYTGGGGYYNGEILTGSPVAIDPTTDLVIPLKGELLPAPPTYTVLAENSAECNQGDPPTHWVPCGSTFINASNQTFGGAPATSLIPAYYVGISNESTPRPVYRFFYPRPGPTTLIIGGSGIISGGGFGTGRYQCAILQGSGVKVDVTLPFTLSGIPTTGTPDTGTAIPSSGSTYGPFGIFCNLFEAGPEAAVSTPTHLLRVGSPVVGFFAGMAAAVNSGVTQLVPMYYGHAAPAGTLIPVLLSQVSGSDGTSTSSPTYTYSGSIYFPAITGIDKWSTGSNTMQPLVRNGTGGPGWYGSYYPAQFGLAFCDCKGAYTLWYAFEQPNGYTGTIVSRNSTNTTTITLTAVNGRIETVTSP